MDYLDSRQLDGLARCWAAHEQAASSAMQRLSRARLRTVFLLIRYAALRLGEALALDDLRDLDLNAAVVRVTGRHAREIPLPRTAAAELKEILERPLPPDLRGRVTALDQGYVRRAFYAMAETSGLPRERLSPSVLRRSRAVELLQGNVPGPVVQRFLGRQTPAQSVPSLPCSDEEAARLVHEFLRRETLRRTSARNAFTGTVTRTDRGPILTAVELSTLSGLTVRAVVTSESAAGLNIREGGLFTASVKAPWVLLSTSAGTDTAGNCYAGVVREVRRDGVTAETVLELADGSLLCALSASRDTETWLRPGRPVFAIVNPLAVILEQINVQG